MTYDPLVDPVPSQWLELSEDERIDVVLEHHRGDGFEPSRAKLHAVTHVVIENILAEGLVDGAAAKLRELVADGLDRHEAIHALGTAVTGSIFEALRSTDRATAPGGRERDLASRIAEVSVESWRGMADADLRPTLTYEDPDAPWIAELETERDELDDTVADQIFTRGSDAVSALIRRLEAGLEPDDMSWAPVHAARLLGRIGDPRAIEALIAAIDATAVEDVLHDAAILALPQLGAPVLDPVLTRATALEPDDIEIIKWADVLAGTRVPDERIFALLEDILPYFPGFAAGCFMNYGDDRAVPLLREVLEAHVPVGDVDEDRVVLDLADAIDSLGGELTRPEVRKCDAYRAFVREARGRPAVKPERPGRNDPCWCGSGKKYKKCHLRSDDGLE